MISTKISPPSYSLGKRYSGSELKQQEVYKNVGPGSYEQHLKNKLSGPKYSLGGRGHSQVQLQTPAPGSYNIPQKVVEHVGQSMGQKYESAVHQVAPGPGSYSPEQRLKSPNIRYSMGAKLRDFELEAKQKLPGPGNYDHTRNSSIMLKSPNTKFGSAQRNAQESIDLKAQAHPGPGAYSVQSFAQVLRDKSPQYRFGSAPKNQVSKSMSPGPGQYQFKTIMGKDGPAVAMHGQRSTSNLLQASRVPGPGAYNPESRSILKRGAAYQMGIKLNDVQVNKIRQSTTGPGQYDPIDSRIKNSGTYKFGTEARMNPLLKDAAHPAPGAYQFKGIIGNEGPKHSMHSRTASHDVHKGKPGPGHYNFDKDKTMSKSPSYVMGVKLQNSHSQSSLQPGPGQYNTIDHTLHGPTSKIGLDKRFHDGKNSVGPGQYQINGIIGKDGPRQSMGVRLTNNSKLNHDKLVPGPGAYQNEKRGFQSSAPAYGMGSSPQRPNQSNTGSPDPQKYNPVDNLVRNRSPGGKMSKDRRRPTYDDKQVNPGPGSYQHNPVAITGKGGVRFGSAEKFALDEKTRLRNGVPGPGTYAHNGISIKNKQPQYTMGGRPNSSAVVSPTKTPAPGQYHNDSNAVKLKAPAYGVGKSQRFQDYAKNAGPGPGSYKIPVTVAHLHQYTSTTNPEYKFV